MKSLIEKAFFLKKLRLFNELDLEILLAIAEKLHEDDYDADEKVFTPGQVANRIYLIVAGHRPDPRRARIDLLQNSTRRLFWRRIAFQRPAPRLCSLCKTDTLFLTLSRSHLLSIISECPSVAVALLQSYSQQLPCRHKGAAAISYENSDAAPSFSSPHSDRQHCACLYSSRL